MNFRTSYPTAKFVHLGDSFNIKGVDGLLIPFDATSGAGQDVDVVLSDGTTTIPVSFDESNNTISVESFTYSVGESFILDGEKASVVDA